MYRSKANKYSNRDRILECIYRNPRISRKEISDLTGITPATVTTTTASLMRQGIISQLGEVEEDRGTIGRSRIALDIRDDYGYVIGAEFTITALTVCATTLHGEILCTRRLPYSPEMCRNITSLIVKYVRQTMSDPAVGVLPLLGIGVAVPGHMDESRNKFICSNPNWGYFDSRTVRETFSVPVVFENNVRCMAVAKYLHAPLEVPSNFALYHIGRGMFCANVADDELYIGTTYGSGEIAHTIAVPGGKRCECGKRGCLQTIATEAAILENARLLMQTQPDSLLHTYAPTPEALTIEHVIAAYGCGDAGVRGLIAQALQYICISALNIAILMNPETLFLHGILFDNPIIRRDFLELIPEHFDFTQNNYRLGTVEFLDSHPTDGAVGAASLAILKCLIHEENKI